MNYYSRYPAHYLAKTLHLSMEQDGAYGRLMDWAYANEEPIPHDKRYVIARAQNPREKRAVDSVLSEFFLRTESGWIQDRIDEEIRKAAPKIEAARNNGLRGGRPKKPKPNGFSDQNPLGFQNETQQEPSAKAPQSPITNNYIGSTEASTQGTTGQPTEPARACLLMRQAGCARVNPSHPDLIAAITEGVTPEVLAATVTEGIGMGKPQPFAWAIATARGRHAEGPKAVRASTGPPGQQQPAMSKTLQALYELEAAKHGDGLDHPGDQLRIAKTGPA